MGLETGTVAWTFAAFNKQNAVLAIFSPVQKFNIFRHPYQMDLHMENITPGSSRHGPVFDVSCNWFRLFAEVCELLNATTQVVRLRTVRMALAGPVPSPRDRAEFSIMGTEKCEAASESIEAMNSGVIKLAVEFTSDTCNLICAMSTAPTGFASGRPVTQGREHQPGFLTAVIQTPSNPLYLASSMTSLVREILAPIHGRATANARRLGAG